MSTWLDSYRASVSWGDQIHAATIAGVECCWHEVKGERVASVPGSLDNITDAIRRATTVQRAINSACRVLFTDETATEAQVEEAMYETATCGVGCGFIEPLPSVYFYGLLEKFSEGHLIDGIIHDLQS